MLVIQQGGSRAGETVDMPMALARRLIAEGRVLDARHKTQLADPDALYCDNRLADSFPAPAPAERQPVEKPPQPQGKRAGRR